MFFTIKLYLHFKLCANAELNSLNYYYLHKKWI